MKKLATAGTVYQIYGEDTANMNQLIASVCVKCAERTGEAERVNQIQSNRFSAEGQRLFSTRHRIAESKTKCTCCDTTIKPATPTQRDAFTASFYC